MRGLDRSGILSLYRLPQGLAGHQNLEAVTISASARHSRHEGGTGAIIRPAHYNKAL